KNGHESHEKFESDQDLNKTAEFGHSGTNGGDLVEFGDKNSYQGFLFKWTNYLYGWQKRYVVLYNGKLSYSLNPNDPQCNFHGVVSLLNANLKVHCKDDLRFDITCHGTCYYFRAQTTEARKSWVNKILSEKDGSVQLLSSRHNSSVSSIGSASSLNSLASTNSKNGAQLPYMLDDLHQFKENMFQQVDSLQSYYDLIATFVRQPNEGANLNDDEDCSNLAYANPIPTSLIRNRAPAIVAKLDNSISPGFVVKRAIGHRHTRSTSFNALKYSMPLLDPKERNSLHAYLSAMKINLDNEISLFRTTTVAAMSTLSSCIESIENSESKSQAEISKVREMNTKLKAKLLQLSHELSKRQNMASPDAIEGPNLKLNEEEFYDAVETAMSLQEEIDILKTLPIKTAEIIENPYQNNMDLHVSEMLSLLKSRLSGDVAWKLSQNDLITKIYKKEMIVDGIVLDPYRVIHIYQGFTAKEVCRFFWDVKYRLQIDNTVDHVFVKATYGSNIVVVHQLHKHIWPATRRDSCFLSIINEVDDASLSDELYSLFGLEYGESNSYKPCGKPWIVANLSVDHPDVSATNCIRVDAKVGLLAQTFIRNSVENPSRTNYCTMINYTASVNPGGWLPISTVRALARRELPKFVKTLGDFSKLETSYLAIEL
ncbi:hypothetical protein MXB_50, partial [Myxobolus squamalis]